MDNMAYLGVFLSNEGYRYGVTPNVCHYSIIEPGVTYAPWLLIIMKSVSIQDFLLADR